MKCGFKISGMILLAFSSFCIHSCKRNGELPTISTSLIGNLSLVKVLCGGNITDEGSELVVERGVCWSTKVNPTIGDSRTNDGSGPGSFTSEINFGLTINETFYVRAYAVNNVGVSYGNEQSFTLCMNVPGPNVTDIDGNSYKTVKIGSQIWMAENLKTTRYRNGELIGTTNPPTLDVNNESSPKYQWAYDGIENSVINYGRLYTWFTITDSRNVCPTGWHVSTEKDWNLLFNYLAESVETVGGKLKEAGTAHWQSPNTGATNETGFTGLPGGCKGNNSSTPGSFDYIGLMGGWWTSTQCYDNPYSAFDRSLGNSTWLGWSGSGCYKNCGLSVRCVLD